MKLPINQILDQDTRPTPAGIATRLGSCFDPFRQLPFLRFGQTRRTPRRFFIRQTFPALHHKLLQPILDALLRYIPKCQNVFQHHPVPYPHPHRHTTHRSLVASGLGLLQFLFQALDGFLGKSYSKHGTSPCALGGQPAA